MITVTHFRVVPKDEIPSVLRQGRESRVRDLPAFKEFLNLLKEEHSPFECISVDLSQDGEKKILGDLKSPALVMQRLMREEIAQRKLTSKYAVKVKGDVVYLLDTLADTYVSTMRGNQQTTSAPAASKTPARKKHAVA